MAAWWNTGSATGEWTTERGMFSGVEQEVDSTGWLIVSKWIELSHGWNGRN